MGCKGYYGHTFFDESVPFFEHRAKYGTANSTTSEKGTDNKKNNSSEYNHEYYMKNKDKWGVGQTYSKDDKDFDESNYDDKDLIGDTDFYLKTRDDGSYYVLLEDTKWNIPKGADVEELKKALQKAATNEDPRQRMAEYEKVFSKYKSGEKEFDVDAAARDVIRGKYKNGAERKAALGEDYEMVQKRVNELMKKEKSKKTETSSSSSSSSETSSKSSGKNRSIQEAYEDEKKRQSAKHSDDLGSVFVRDLY